MNILNLLQQLSIVSSGLFAGLMMTLVFIMQRQWKTMTREGYYQNFKGFLSVAKGDGLITVLTLFSFLIPIPVGIIEILRGAFMEGLLVLIAGLVFLLGCFLVTMKLNFPIYNKVMAWKSADDAEDWDWVRRRFFLLNIIRFSSSAATFLLLIFSRSV